ncbi:MAG: hypothetical protein BGO49_30760 [Planctomycetales bacterium 71-10]|nr:MAG: hypothetical protein BGO49_30760 [Planctomycetales bacterium 71-10]
MRLAPATLVALAAMLALAPRPAQAGCSSRVHPGEHSRAIGLDELTGDDAPPPGRIPPCSGPMCSDGPGTPMAPVLIAPDVWRELWCDASAACRRDRTGRPLAPGDGPPAAPSPDPADVERPPRRPAA